MNIFVLKNILLRIMFFEFCNVKTRDWLIRIETTWHEYCVNNWISGNIKRGSRLFYQLFIHLFNDNFSMPEKSDTYTMRVIYIRNMVSKCCITLIREKLQEIRVHVHDLSLGKATISYDELHISFSDIEYLLERYGFTLVEKREERLVNAVKTAVVELIHQMNNVNSIVRKSEYLVEKLGYSYPYLSKIFSEHEHITLERYIILHKIERIKHLIDQDEHSLTEIAYMMDYSSVQYLSNQFKSITGMTVSRYRQSDGTLKTPLEEL